MVFSWFHHENRLVAHFLYHIRNQRVEIHKYTKFEENRKIQLFGTAPKFGIKICSFLKIYNLNIVRH